MVTLSAFCMGLTEATVNQYRACTAPGCISPGTDAYCNWNDPRRENHPVNCVNAFQAREYCQFVAGDPTDGGAMGVCGARLGRPRVPVGVLRRRRRSSVGTNQFDPSSDPSALQSKYSVNTIC